MGPTFLIFPESPSKSRFCASPYKKKIAWQIVEDVPYGDFYLPSDSANGVVRSETGCGGWGWGQTRSILTCEKANRSGRAWVLTLSHSSSNVQSATVPQALFSRSSLPCTFRILGLVTMGTRTKTQSCLDNYYKIHLLQIGNA